MSTSVLDKHRDQVRSQRRNAFQKTRQRPPARRDQPRQWRRQSNGPDLSTQLGKKPFDFRPPNSAHVWIAWIVISEVVPKQGRAGRQHSNNLIGNQAPHFIVEHRGKKSRSNDQLKPVVFPGQLNCISDAQVSHWQNLPGPGGSGAVQLDSVTPQPINSVNQPTLPNPTSRQSSPA